MKLVSGVETEPQKGYRYWYQQVLECNLRSKWLRYMEDQITGIQALKEQRSKDLGSIFMNNGIILND